MPTRKPTFDTVRKIGLTLPGVVESTMYGTPALKVGGKLLACVPSHSSAEPDSLAVRIDFADRAELLADAPDVYYVTGHYLDYNAVLVRLSRVTPAILRDLLAAAHKFVVAGTKPSSPTRRRSRPATRKRRPAK
ncbi:MAG TPA: MmcQ/YjbR family DNA-binding protein [Terriglobales bacterium]